MTDKPLTWGDLRDLLRDCPGCETARLLCADETPVWARRALRCTRCVHDHWHVLAGQFVETIGYTPLLR